MHLDDRLRSYLCGLPLQAQAQLLRRLDELRLRGEAEPAHTLIMQHLRGILREEHEAASLLGMPQPIFREPLEPFLVDEIGSRNHRGRISRRSLIAIWRWLSELPDFRNLEELAEASAEALLSGDYARARSIARTVRQRSLPLISAALDKAAHDARSRMHLALQLEGARALSDLTEIAAVFRLEKRLTKFGAKLPARIENLTPDLVELVLRRLRFDPDDLIYPFVLLYSRLSQPIQLLRIAVSHAGTDDGKAIAESGLAGPVEVVLGELDFIIERMIGHLDRGGDFDRLIETVRCFYSLTSGVAVAIELDSAPEWSGRLAESRRRASDAITPRLSEIPGAVRRALKPTRRDAGRVQAPDPEDVKDALHAARLMAALRPYRGELAVNTVLADTIRAVEHFVEAANGLVLQTLKTAPAHDKPAARQLLEAAISINAIVFGENYAALLRRSGQLADPRSDFGTEEDDDDDSEEELEASFAPSAA